MGSQRKLSDLDLCYMEHIPANSKEQLNEDFDASDLPFKVDLVDYYACNKTFQNNIKKNLLLIKV